MKVDQLPVVSVAGSGNVGSFLAVNLHKAGCIIRQIYSRQLGNAEKLAAKVGAGAITNPTELDTNIDLLIIALPDRAIVGFISSVTGGNHEKLKFVIASTAGSVNLSEFAHLHINSGVLYPLQSFTLLSDPKAGNIPFMIEGASAETAEFLIGIASLISSDVRYLESNKRLILHIAAVFASNFTNHMLVLANKILSETDMDFGVLMPLVTETISRLKDNSPENMQTGPAIRGDENTMNKHLEVLSDLNYTQLTAVYKTISESIRQLSIKND